MSRTTIAAIAGASGGLLLLFGGDGGGILPSVDVLAECHKSDRMSKTSILFEMASKEFDSDQQQADWWNDQIEAARAEDFQPFVDAVAEAIDSGTGEGIGRTDRGVEVSEFTGLPLPTEDVEERLDKLDHTVCQSINEDDFPDWEEFLKDEENDPKLRMRQQLQRRNDCQGQALCNGEERRSFYVTGQIVQLSDTYAYQASEYHDGTVGRDRGTSIAAGVEVLTKGLPGVASPGIPTEAAFSYEPYYRSKNSFLSKAKQTKVDLPHVNEHYAAPPFRQMLIGIAAGGSLHWGTYWSLPWGRDRVVVNPGRAGRGGHATEGIWARWVRNHWQLEVWNSHGDPEPYYVREDEYEFLRQRRNSPFGAFMILPDRAEERYEFKLHDWKAKLKA